MYFVPLGHFSASYRTFRPTPKIVKIVGPEIYHADNAAARAYAQMKALVEYYMKQETASRFDHPTKIWRILLYSDRSPKWSLEILPRMQSWGSKIYTRI